MTSPPSNEPKKLPLRVKLPFASESEFIDRYGLHVARGGIFIATRAPKPEGTALSFELVLADGTRLMRGEGVVQTVSSDHQPGRSGMLVRLTRIDAKTKALIDQIVTGREGLGAAEGPVLPASPAPPPTWPTPVPARASSPSRPPIAAPPLAPAPASAVAPGDDVVLGIDLGTTTCRAAVVIDGVARLVPIPSERGSTAMPSIVAFDSARGRLLVGSDAKKHRIEKAHETIVGFKRLLGRRAASKKVKELAQRFSFSLTSDPEGDVGVELGEQVYPLVSFAAELLKELKNAAQNFLGRPLKRAVLCVPAWYTDHQRSAVLEAARLAGLEVGSILNEPSAVALAFGYGKGLARKRVLVYDLGGGTFDASVVEITGDDLEVVSTGGDDFLGGLDFDERLADALLSSMPEGPRNRLSVVSHERVRDAAEVAKIALSQATSTTTHVPFASTADDGAPVDLCVEVERSFLESVTADLVERTVQVTQVVLEAAKLQPQSLDELLLVGGQSSSPAVRKRLEQLLGRPARSDVDPQGAVALGAALFGQSLVLRERGKRGLSLSDVLVAPIGIAVKGGGFRRVLERNTRLPAEKNLVLPGVAGVPLRIGVFQGSAPRADDNEYLGALTTACERSGDMQVRFAVTADGRLALSATTPLGREAVVTFATAQASDEVQAQLLESAPLPGDDQRPASSKSGLFGGIKKLFGR
jgi:molecular chaperone DnaK